MHADLQERAAFYLSGKRASAEQPRAEQLGLRPASLAAYRDLTALRYDFPLVLIEDSPETVFAEPLSELIDRALDEAGLAGKDAERLRIHALGLERELRSMAARDAPGSLPALMDDAARHMTVGGDAKLFADSMRRLKGALNVKGALVDCDRALPARLMTHAWQAVQKRKAAAFRRNVDRLILKLNEILAADLARSGAGRAPDCLKAAVGGAFEDEFDFDRMSHLLQRVATESSLADARRQRIESTLGALASQRFFVAGQDVPLHFEFDSCKRAAAAFRMRLPAMVELMRAITAAELEIEGELDGPRHEALLRQLGDHRLDPRELTQFPDYLVCIKVRDLHTDEVDELTELLARGLPMKVLVQTDDLLSEPLEGAGTPAVGARSRQLANMAIGLNEVFVLQSASSNLMRCHDRILKAMNHPGPALISVFSGAGSGAGAGGGASESDGLPPYLKAAAAMESHAFPAFSYDPSAGRDWASRFTLDGNPQPECDWSTHELVYEDAEHQRVTEQAAFTLVDFIACDRRYARHFAIVPREQGNDAIASVAACLDREGRNLPDQFPGLWMVDRNNILQRVIIDESLVRETRRCRDAWRSLQELARLGGASTASGDTAQGKSADAAAQPLAATVAPTTPASAAPAGAPSTEAPAELDGAHAPGEAYIETARCSSCNECIQLNGKMFAYDANQQARIVDLGAGTYREMVEAAESCQVAVIHPGKPLNPNEPGLEELLKRAEAFN